MSLKKTGASALIIQTNWNEPSVIAIRKIWQNEAGKKFVKVEGNWSDLNDVMRNAEVMLFDGDVEVI